VRSFVKAFGLVVVLLMGSQAYAANLNVPKDFDQFQWHYVCESDDGHRASVLIRNGYFFYNEDGRPRQFIITSASAAHGGVNEFGHNDPSVMQLYSVHGDVAHDGDMFPLLTTIGGVFMHSFHGGYNCLIGDDPELEDFANRD
jgi:hypothetical protein